MARGLCNVTDLSSCLAFFFCSMQHILNAGVKVLLMASLNDQVVPLYSALFSSLSHPSLLRAIFIDAQAFETSADFMTNLVSNVWISCLRQCLLVSRV